MPLPFSILEIDHVVLRAADALLVPTIPTTLSKRTLDQLTEFLAEHPPAPMVLPFASMVDRRKRLQRDLVAQLSIRTVPGLPASALTDVDTEDDLERLRRSLRDEVR